MLGCKNWINNSNLSLGYAEKEFAHQRTSYDCYIKIYIEPQVKIVIEMSHRHGKYTIHIEQDTHITYLIYTNKKNPLGWTWRS